MSSGRFSCYLFYHYTFFYRQLGCLAFRLRFWLKIKQFLSNWIGLFLSKQLIFAKSFENQLYN